jgi:hypothetical protein
MYYFVIISNQISIQKNEAKRFIKSKNTPINQEILKEYAYKKL